MSRSPAAAVEARPREVGRSPSAAGLAARLSVALLLFLLALGPRLAGLGEATTEDEDQWVQRTGNFARALGDGNWRGTYQVGHPGVTTMWLAALALGPARAARLADRVRPERLVTQAPDFLPALHAARLPFAAADAALVTLCGLLAWRLFGPGPGLTGALLLALEPYWSAMAPIVGMDGLLAGLMGAALLSAVLGFRPAPGGRWWVLVSGLLAGLALLTKAPAVFLLPVVPMLALIEVGPAPRRPGAWRTAALKLALWGLGLGLAAALWPALWADPLGTIRRAATFVDQIGTEAHGPGNFFLGQPIDDPGPLFYPVALALRVGPPIVPGLVLLAALRPPPRARGLVSPLLVYLLLFGIGLTVSPKRVDRYLLPLFPVLGILAGLGWWRLLSLLADRLRRPALAPLGVALLAAAQLWPLVGAYPHPLAAYNPLFGGIRAAEQAIPVGWGEGLDTAGAYLRQQPDADGLKIGVWYPLWVNFQAHAPGQVVNVTFSRPGQVDRPRPLDNLDYYVDYIHARQRGLTPSFLLDRAPDFVVTIDGVEYARVYRLKP